MAGVSDFVTMAALQLGVSEGAASAATGSVASIMQKASGPEFGKIASAVPGLSDYAAKGGGPGGALVGLASKAGALVGGAGTAAGVLAAVTAAGVTGDKARAFLSLFVNYLKSKVGADALKGMLAKMPGLVTS
jgi:hypothetical protein